MNKIRYLDKEILCNYDLREEFFNFLGIKIIDTLPLRKVFVLFTPEGKRILKITAATEERVKFIDKSLLYIEKKFPTVLKYCKNKNNEIITNWKGQKFIILEMIEGREATFTNPIEVELCTKALANMHLASTGILDSFTKEEIKENLSVNLIIRLKEELNLLNEIKSNVVRFKYKNNFDNIFISIVDKLIFDLTNTISLIDTSEFNTVFNDISKLTLCHNDLAHHNFIIDNEEVSIIDFDYCNLSTRIMDIYNFSSKVLKTIFYDKKIFDLIIKSYSEVSFLSNEEIKILKILFNYPNDLIRISISYYLKEKSWEEKAFISKLENKLELDEYRRDFLMKI